MASLTCSRLHRGPWVLGKMSPGAAGPQGVVGRALGGQTGWLPQHQPPGHKRGPDSRLGTGQMVIVAGVPLSSWTSQPNWPRPQAQNLGLPPPRLPLYSLVLGQLEVSGQRDEVGLKP
ncbi:hypothetical protein J1605_008606 [Eschrichtius robustus]|uniref:Uncharacterized protein n=1 Tax=Eschrichtius robustus TaxID=9764 RepID=A0AB34GUF0_ESCRO|nr:hypothetical protein J1605_008606 [Eschrichtius robustus]